MLDSSATVVDGDDGAAAVAASDELWNPHELAMELHRKVKNNKNDDDESASQLRMPQALSPSSAMEFRRCPQSFLFKYVLKLSLSFVKGFRSS